MKHLRLYEDYGIDEIYSWWAGIKVTENEDYYSIDLSDVYLANKIIQLQKGLKNKVVRFRCKNHMKYEEFEVKNVESLQDGLIFKAEDYLSGMKQNTVHVVDLTKPIKISKLHLATNKYNL